MSSSIEERVVSMKFDNAQFEQGIKTTLASLDTLNKGLKLEGATPGLQNVASAAGNMQLGAVAAAIEDIASKFKAMSVIAITTLATVASHAVTAGYSLAKSLTVDPINAGLQEYQTNINAIQTILSNTRWQHTGLNDVTKALDELNHYADLTIYNFTQMVQNIGTFTAAGVKMDVAVSAIKGIANLAAVSGSSAEQAATAMYQLSQAIATGTVKLIDWNSVVNAGLGGKVFQDALIQTAKVHGVAVDQMIKQQGSFRATLENGWLTAQILTETLSHFTGDLNEKQLESLGYSKDQALAIVAMGKDALDAATKVKTITQLINTLQEAVGSGWTQTWQIIFGNFNEARDLFSGVYNTLNKFVSANADARNKVLQDWKDLGGRAAFLQAIGNTFNALISVLSPIKDAFREIFPAKTGKDLADFSKALERFTDRLFVSGQTADKLRRTFAGLFAIFGIGWDITKQLVRVFFDLFGIATQGSGDFLNTTASIGDFFVGLHKAIETGQGLIHFFDELEKILIGPIRLLQILAYALGSLFTGFDGTKAAAQVTGFVQSIRPLTFMADLITKAWSGVVSIFDKLYHVMEPIGTAFVKFFSDVTAAVGGLNFEDVLHTINTGSLATIAVVIARAFGGGGKGSIKAVFTELTNTLKTMQTTLQAATLLEIAAAVGLLAISTVALSNVDPKRLASALVGIGVMLGELMAALAVLKTIPGGGVIRLYAYAGSLLILATAIDLLTISVKVLADLDATALHRGLISVLVLIGGLVAAGRLLPDGARLISTGLGLLILAAGIRILADATIILSRLSYEQIGKGLTAVAGILAALTLFSRFAQANASSAISAVGIVILAAGIEILADALAKMGNFSWEQIGKGLTTLAGALAIVGVALSLIPPSSVFSAVGVLIVATSLGLIADSLAKMGGFSWVQIGKGLTVLAGALTLIGLAISLIPPTAPLSAAGVLIVALAVGLLADSLAKMGGFSWTQIGKGLVTLAGALGIISAALFVMQGTLGGAAALVIVAGALVILTGVLEILGHTPISDILIGLGALAGVFFILGLAGYALTPVVPTLLGLAGAIALIGAGLALAGLGVFLFAAGLTALGAAGAVGAAGLVAIVSAVIGLVPAMVKALALAIIALIDLIANAAPHIVKAVIDILIAILDGIVKAGPSIGQGILAILTLILTIIVAAVPKIVNAWLDIILGVLKAIRDHMHDFVVVALGIIGQFLKGIGDGSPQLIQGAIDMIVAFMHAIGKGAKDNGDILAKAAVDMAADIIQGLLNGIEAGAKEIADKILQMVKDAWNAALDFLGIGSPSKLFAEMGKWTVAGFVKGVDDHSDEASKSTEKMGNRAVDSLGTALRGVGDLIDSNVDLTPTITPVVDLTYVKAGVNEMNTLTARPKGLTIAASYSSIKQLGSEIDQVQSAGQTEQQPTAPTNNVTFNQYNSSPKALDAPTIYRQTKNQIAAAKREVLVNA